METFDNKSGQSDNNVLDNLKIRVKNYLKVDDELKQLEKKVKDLKENKKTLTADIIGFMTTHNIEDLTTDTGNLKRSVTRVKKPLNKKIIKSKLMEFFKNSEKETDQLIKLLNDREREEKVKLQRIVPK